MATVTDTMKEECRAIVHQDSALLFEGKKTVQ